jgi:PAS domain S-box-containing protein
MPWCVRIFYRLSNNETMMKKSNSRFLATMAQALTSLVFVLATLLPCTASYAVETVYIGIQAIRPKEQMLKQWQPLRDALKQAIPERDFTFVPLAHEEMESAVASRQLDFVLTNPAHFVLMANRSGLSSPLATLNDVDNGQPMPVFGGVIFCRTEQTELNTLADIRGKTIAATGANAFGSYQMQAYELSLAGIRLPQDGKVLFTGLPQDKVVAEVMSGRAEIGFVRTGLLEKMAQEGKIDIKQIKIINPQRMSGYTARLSTRLYPNWAFAALPNIDERLARKVTTVLLALEDNTAATHAIGIQGFVIPADYLPVENMLRALHVPPFEALPEFTVQDVWQKYRLWILFILVGSLAILSLVITMLMLNRRLRMSEERLRLATTAGNIGIWDWDIANNVLTWDASMYSLYGIRTEDFCGAYDAWSKTLHPDDRQFTEAEIQAALRGEREYAPEFRIVRTDGSVRDMKADSKTYYDSQGKALRMVGINIDLTERKQAEERFRQLFANMSSGAVVYRAVDEGEDFIFVDFNSAVERIERLTRDELIGKRVTEAFPSIRKMGLLETFKRVWKSGQPEHYPLSFYSDNKISGWRENYAYRLTSGELVVIYDDVTARKQAEEALKRYKDHLEEEVQTRTADLILARDAAEAANKAKSVFLTSINHELRTPLNAILGFSNLLRQDTKLRPEQRTNLDIINRSGEHLLTLINDVLEMAKIEAGKTQLNITPFDFGALVRDVADMMHMRTQEKGLRLLVDQSSEFPRYVKSDEARLRQVLINLVGNAIKFTRQGGVTMRFGIKPHDVTHHLLIEIEDSGIGISAEDQQNLFKPFIQMGALPGDNKGTGLGLAITKQFVQLMGGTISVESTLGKGSLFRVELPFSKVDASELSELDASGQDEVAGLEPGQPAYRILIVEDQLENQLLLTQLMQRIGLEVKLAEDGKQGVQLFKSWQPHLIWMDRRMPVMDGVEATQIIRQLPGGKEVKIVAVTASALMEERDEMLTAGMDDFVRKPYRFNEIYDSLSRQLGVRYTYNEMRDNPEKSPPVALTAEMLEVLPPALRSELKAALESLTEERIDAALQKVESHDAALHSVLSRLVENFDYPSILNALRSNGSETEA